MSTQRAAPGRGGSSPLAGANGAPPDVSGAVAVRRHAPYRRRVDRPVPAAADPPSVDRSLSEPRHESAFRRRLVSARPGVVTSTLFHTLLLVGLAILSQAPLVDRPGAILVGQLAEAPESLETVVPLHFEPPADSQPLDRVATPESGSAAFTVPPTIAYFDGAATQAVGRIALDSQAAMSGTLGTGEAVGGGDGAGQGRAPARGGAESGFSGSTRRVTNACLSSTAPGAWRKRFRMPARSSNTRFAS